MLYMYVKYPRFYMKGITNRKAIIIIINNVRILRETLQKLICKNEKNFFCLHKLLTYFVIRVIIVLY